MKPKISPPGVAFDDMGSWEWDEDNLQWKLSEFAGRKDDNGKPRFGLIPPLALEEVAKVLTHGAAKYGASNWRTLSNLTDRYRDALGRHVNAFDRNELLDRESGLHHLAHAICCLMFILEKQLEFENE